MLLNINSSLIYNSQSVLQKINFQGSPEKGFLVNNTMNYIENNIIGAADAASRKAAIANFRKTFTDVYDLGSDKWQNPRYHQFTVTDHMLKAIEQSALIVNGKHEEINKVFGDADKKELLKVFDEKIDGISKKSLFVLAMAFHDLDKVTKCKPRLEPSGNLQLILPLEHKSFIEEIDYSKDHHYWTAHYDSDDAVNLFKKVSAEIGLPGNAEKYVCDILINHDNPLRCVVWEIENGQKNVSQLFDDMKQQTPFSIKELALVYLADQSAKGEKGWLDHLESVSPWRSLFKSMLYERPLEELTQLLEN